MASEFWPWWLSGAALATAALLNLILTGRPLGVSGAWAKVVHFWAELEAEALQRDMLADAETERALLAATEAQFGPAATRGSASQSQFGAAATGDASPGSQAGTAAGQIAPGPPSLAAPPLNVSSSALFLLSLALGGTVSALLRGDWGTHATLGPAFVRLWGDGVAGLAVLLVGGVLVGFGTRLSGGCTSGHGLMGCSRLQVPSLVATATFLGTAVALSLLLDRAGLR